MSAATHLNGDLAWAANKAPLVKDHRSFCFGLPVFHEKSSYGASRAACGNIFNAPLIIPGAPFHCWQMKNIDKFRADLCQQSCKITMNDARLFQALLEDDEQIRQARRNHLHRNAVIEGIGGQTQRLQYLMLERLGGNCAKVGLP